MVAPMKVTIDHILKQATKLNRVTVLGSFSRISMRAAVAKIKKWVKSIVFKLTTKKATKAQIN